MSNVLYVDFHAKRGPIAHPTPAVDCWLGATPATDDEVRAMLHLHVSTLNRMLDEQAATFGEIKP